MKIAGGGRTGGGGRASNAAAADAARRGHRKSSVNDGNAGKNNNRSRSKSKGRGDQEESDEKKGGGGTSSSSAGGSGDDDDEEEEEEDRGNGKVNHECIPCSCPDGACDRSCACFAKGNYCERGCGCPISCPFRFPGCDCRSGCQTNTCPCLAASHECDPDLCRNCKLAPAIAAFGGIGGRSNVRQGGAGAGETMAVTVADVLAARAPAPVKAAVAAAALRGFGGGSGDRVTCRGAGLKRMPAGLDYATTGSARVSSWAGWQHGGGGALELGDSGASVAAPAAAAGDENEATKKEKPSGPPPSSSSSKPAFNPSSANVQPCRNMRLRLRQHRRLAMGRSAVAGWGCFVLEKANKGDLLGEYVGELVNNREADRRGKAYDRDNNSYLFDLSKEAVIDARGKGCKLRFANHSQDANCSAKILVVDGDSRVAIFAARDLEPGEELFYDYMYDEHNAPPWARD